MSLHCCNCNLLYKGKLVLASIEYQVDYREGDGQGLFWFYKSVMTNLLRSDGRSNRW